MSWYVIILIWLCFATALTVIVLRLLGGNRDDRVVILYTIYIAIIGVFMTDKARSRYAKKKMDKIKRSHAKHGV